MENSSELLLAAADKAAAAKAAKQAKAKAARERAKAAAAAKQAAADKQAIPEFNFVVVAKEKTLSPLQAANKAFLDQAGSLTFCLNGVRKLWPEFRAIVKAKADSGRWNVDNEFLNKVVVNGDMTTLIAVLPDRKGRWSINALKAAIIKIAVTKR